MFLMKILIGFMYRKNSKTIFNENTDQFCAKKKF